MLLNSYINIALANETQTSTFALHQCMHLGIVEMWMYVFFSCGFFPSFLFFASVLIFYFDEFAVLSLLLKYFGAECSALKTKERRKKSNKIWRIWFHSFAFPVFDSNFLHFFTFRFKWIRIIIMCRSIWFVVVCTVYSCTAHCRHIDS